MGDDGAMLRGLKNSNLSISLMVSGLFVSVGSVAFGQSTLYVDDSASPGGNGLSWSTAYKDLQVALTAAANSAGAVHEIRVGGGTYRPGPPNGNRVSSIFILREGVAIRGGYAGYGATNPNARDFILYESILSGDLNGNDGPDFSNRGDNSYHVVGASGVGPTAELDGFTITGGYANGGNPNDRGAAIFLFPFANSPTFRNCRIIGNRVTGKGGAMYTNESSATFYHCAFEGNQGNDGGAIYHLQSAARYFSCSFEGNVSSGLAGAMYNYGSNTLLEDCTFSENSGLAGGAMHNFQSSPMLRRCVFQRNMAAGGLAPNGGAISNEPGSPTLADCLFVANMAVNRGGGMYNSHADSHPVIRNALFWKNIAGSGGGMAVNNGMTTVVNSIFWENVNHQGQHSENTEVALFGGSLVMNYSCVQGWTGLLGGQSNGAFAPEFVDATGPDGLAGTMDDDLRPTPTSDCIDRGDPAWLMEESGSDFDGRARVLCGRVDIGPFEFGLGDATCDRFINLEDYAQFPNCLELSWAGLADDECAAFQPRFPGRVDLEAFSAFQNLFGG